MTGKAPRYAHALLVILAGAMLTGCPDRSRRSVAIQPIVPAAADLSGRLPLSAALVMTSEFQNYAVDDMVINEPNRIVIGHILSQYGLTVARQAFSRVQVFDAESRAVDQADVILIPKVARSNEFMQGEIDVLVVVEWMVKNSSGQRTLWVGSVEGKAQEAISYFAPSLDEYETAAYQRAFQSLTEASVRALQNAPEIRKVALGVP